MTAWEAAAAILEAKVEDPAEQTADRSSDYFPCQLRGLGPRSSTIWQQASVVTERPQASVVAEQPQALGSAEQQQASAALQVPV